MFGEKLKELRIGKNMTQQELAKILKISSSSIGMYEQNRRSPDVETLKMIAEYFHVSVDYLLGRTDIKNSSDESSNDEEFKTPEAAMKFIVEQPALAAFGGYDLNKMSDKEIIDFANELLRQLKLLGYKYKK